MPLIPPEVIAPLSNCSTHVRIRGNIAGATLEIFVDDEPTASIVTSRFDATYAIGAPVNADSQVTARQVHHGETSPKSLPVIVAAAPAQPANLTLLTTPYRFGRAIRMQGAVPGARVDGTIGNTPIGGDKAVSGTVGFTYDPVLVLNEVIGIKQVTCGDASSAQSSPKGLPLPSPLPRPTIVEPLVECQRSITIDGVIDGAYVELYRNGRLERTYTFAERREWRSIAALKLNDVIEVRQGFKHKKESPDLELASPKRSRTVKPVSSLPKPMFTNRLCGGTTMIGVAGLIPGARVVLAVDDQVLGETDAADTSALFSVPKLPNSGTVRAWMRLCDKDGPAADRAIEPGQGSPDELIVPELYQCVSHVLVGQNYPVRSCIAVLTNAAGQHISGYHALDIPRFIPVSPSLIAGDKVTVNVQACGGEWKAYGPYPVIAGPSSLTRPTVPNQLWAGLKYVFVASPFAGARLDLYVNDTWRGWALSRGAPGSTAIHFATELKTGDVVTATQTLCGKVSKASDKNTVVKAPPQAPELLSPADGAVDIGTQPLFTWKDPSADLENRADSFRVRVSIPLSGTNVVDTLTSTPQLACPAVLSHSTTYEWAVDGINSTGRSVSAWRQFTVGARPAPPEPQSSLLRFVPPIYSMPANFPRTHPFEIRISVENAGAAPSASFVVGIGVSLWATGELVHYDEQSFDPLDAGSERIMSLPVNIGGTEELRIDAFLWTDGSLVDEAFRVV